MCIKAASARSHKPCTPAAPCVVPFSHDQPDNAERAQRLGIGRAFPRAKFRVEAAVAALGELLAQPRYAAAAADVACRLQQEDGVAAALQ